MNKKSFKFIVTVLSFMFGVSVLHAEPTQIMPLGDSITYDHQESDIEDPRPISKRTAYRSHLYYNLVDANYSVDFVGSKVAGQGVTPPFDPDNEGHPGWSSFDIAEKVNGYLTQNHADIVLLHIGTNDHGTFTGGVDSILNEIDRYEVTSGRPVKVIVAMIIDRQKQNDEIIGLFNDNLKELIGSRIKNGDNLTLVDMYRGAGMVRTDYADLTHPNDSGYRKMAAVWTKTLLSPYTPGLHAFPYTLVNESYVQSVSVSTATHSVSFVTEVPDTGITF